MIGFIMRPGSDTNSEAVATLTLLIPPDGLPA